MFLCLFVCIKRIYIRYTEAKKLMAVLIKNLILMSKVALAKDKKRQNMSHLL